MCYASKSETDREAGLTGEKGEKRETMVDRGAYAQCTMYICIKIDYEIQFHIQ